MIQPKKRFRSFLKRLLAYFLKGLLLAVPVTVTVYVLYKSFVFLDNLLPNQLPGIGILIIFSAITFLGFLGTTIIQEPLLQAMDRLLERIPLVKFIYTSIRDLLSAFVGKEKMFNKPVMVKMNEQSEVYKLGFITQKDLSAFKIDEGFSAVYLPHSYNFSGNLFIVSNNLIRSLDIPSDEAMKFIVSGGISKKLSSKEK
jgi:uncharacterized membrane protein